MRWPRGKVIRQRSIRAARRYWCNDCNEASHHLVLPDSHDFPQGLKWRLEQHQKSAMLLRLYVIVGRQYASYVTCKLQVLSNATPHLPITSHSMPPTNLQHRRTHNLLLINKLLSQRDASSPFTLVLDSLEQSARPLISEYMRRAKVSVSKPRYGRRHC